MRWPEPANTEQREAQTLRPTKGGAVRIRIALATALAVTFTLSSITIDPAGAQAAPGQPGVPPHHVVGAPSFILIPFPLGAGAATPPLGTGHTVTDHALWSGALQQSAQAAPPPTDATSTDTADWQCIRVQESGDVYNDPTRPSGAYGILEVTWQSNGYSGWPYEGTPAQQDALALKLYNEFGWVPWSSRYACGL
jgi:hypothetical protein